MFSNRLLLGALLASSSVVFAADIKEGVDKSINPVNIHVGIDSFTLLPSSVQDLIFAIVRQSSPICPQQGPSSVCKAFNLALGPAFYCSDINELKALMKRLRGGDQLCLPWTGSFNDLLEVQNKTANHIRKLPPTLQKLATEAFFGWNYFGRPENYHQRLQVLKLLGFESNTSRNAKEIFQVDYKPHELFRTYDHEAMIRHAPKLKQSIVQHVSSILKNSNDSRISVVILRALDILKIPLVKVIDDGKLQFFPALDKFSESVIFQLNYIHGALDTADYSDIAIEKGGCHAFNDLHPRNFIFAIYRRCCNSPSGDYEKVPKDLLIEAIIKAVTRIDEGASLTMHERDAVVERLVALMYDKKAITELISSFNSFIDEREHEQEYRKIFSTALKDAISKHALTCLNAVIKEAEEVRVASS
jgi:hypothetical protein